MLFNSTSFIGVFLPIVFCGFLLLGRLSHRLAELWLCLASLFFYGYWNINYVWLLLASVCFNYVTGYWIGRYSQICPQLSQGILTFAMVADLSLLGYYKYAQFFVNTLDCVPGIDMSIGQIILPLGISFFTFTQIAFLVDAYRGKVPEQDFVHYLLFVTYFPHLIAGPILHHAQMMPQFALKPTYRFDARNAAIGVTLFVLGLSKKVLLADMFSPTATAIFQATDHGASPMFVEAWIGALAYTLQLYFDFSGYTDMALGTSYIFNIKLPFNFNSPYKATNIIDFWRRWHMTLSLFLRDYLYIPLGGNRHGSFCRYRNLIITMLLGGLWHGAAWTFVMWGGLHGFYLMVNHGFQALRDKMNWEPGCWGRLGRLVSIATTFLCVVVAWVFFRANTFDTALCLLRGMVGLHGLSLTNSSGPLPLSFVHLLNTHGIVFSGFTPITLFTGPTLCKLAAGLMIIWFFPNSQEWMNLSTKLQTAIRDWSFFGGWQPASTCTCFFIGLLMAVCLLTLMSGPPSEFLYFQF